MGLRESTENLPQPFLQMDSQRGSDKDSDLNLLQVMAKLRIESMGKNSKMVNSCSSAMLVIGDDDLVELILVLSMKVPSLCFLSLILEISGNSFCLLEVWPGEYYSTNLLLWLLLS
ncbi:unnamed protein product [Cuscuta europaea]|uniref:Uncharacterized protein n=1 Tax=Cuscuta europaea TaxID=41803 RepID=A0A9P0YVK4_CUSEU|nr:unnamed protein product [Cuscuta europaea]